MAQVIYAARALADLDRLTDFLLVNDPRAASATAALIIEAVSVLAHHPLIGRAVEYDLRELIIARGESGYVALYSHELLDDVVLILAIRHQREAGYVGD